MSQRFRGSNYPLLQVQTLQLVLAIQTALEMDTLPTGAVPWEGKDLFFCILARDLPYTWNRRLPETLLQSPPRVHGPEVGGTVVGRGVTSSFSCFHLLSSHEPPALFITAGDWLLYILVSCLII